MKKIIFCLLLSLSASAVFCQETARRNALSFNLGQTLSGALLWHDKTFIVPIDYEYDLSDFIIADLTVAPRYAAYFDVGFSLGAKLLTASWVDIANGGQRIHQYIGLYPIYDFRPVETFSGDRGFLNFMVSVGVRDRW